MEKITINIQKQIDHILTLGEKLSDSNPSIRLKAVNELNKIYDKAWEKHKPVTLDPEIIPAFRINAQTQLANSIRQETNNDVIIEMIQLASKIGNGEPSITESLVEIMKTPSFHEPGEIIGTLIVEAICKMGIPSRLYAIEKSFEMDSFHRIGVVANLVAGGITKKDGIYSTALSFLSESSREADWDCLLELSHVFEREVTRNELKDALIKVLRKAKGIMKENTIYILRRRGFTRFLFLWI